MKKENKKYIFLTLLIILLLGLVYSYTPPGTIDMRNFYNITNVPYYNGTAINITGNVTASWFLGKLNWSNVQSIPTIVYLEVDPKWTANITNYFTKAQWNVTNSSYSLNQTLADMWLPFLNTTNLTYLTIDRFNVTNTSYLTNYNISVMKIWQWNATNTSYYLASNPNAYWNTTFATFNKTYADTLYHIIGNELIDVLNWTKLQNYPVSCPTNTFVTQIDDSITCTGINELDPKWTANITNYFTKAQWNVTNTSYLMVDRWNATNESYLKDYGDTATGNYTFDTNTFFIDATNDRVGIGTTAPGSKLQVNQSADDEGIRIYGYDDRSTSYTKIGINEWGWLIFSGNTGGVNFGAQALKLNSNQRIVFGDSNSYSVGQVSSDDTFRITDGNDLTTAPRIVINRSGNVGIGTTTPQNKLNVVGGGNFTSQLFVGTGAGNGYTLAVGNTSKTNYSLISAYFEGNITSAGYITRTSIYDTSKGSALNYIQNASYYLNNGIINHSKFYGYTNWTIKEIDYSKPVIIVQDKEVCSGLKENKTCIIEKENIITYPNTIPVQNKGVNIGSEIDVLRQAVYELKLQNEELKTRVNKIETETCTIKLFSWCMK